MQYFHETEYKLGHEAFSEGRFNDALLHGKNILDADPDNSVATAFMASIYTKVGDWQKALTCYKKARDLSPHDPRHHDDYLYFLHHDPHLSDEILFKEHCSYQKLFEGHELPLPPRPKNTKIRLGFISSDLHEHATAFLLEPVLTLLDRNLFELFLYSTGTVSDAFTERFKGLATNYRDVSEVTAPEMRTAIIDDAIDILFDMGGHTAENSLPVFALRSAPIQISWFGYMNTTGLRTIDYRLTDHWRTPPERTHLYTEKLIYLPNSYIFTPQTNILPEITSIPSQENGFITFGSFNTVHKIHDETLQLWSTLLSNVPKSRLKVMIPRSEEYREWLLDQFNRRGISADRIIPTYNLPLVPFLREIGTVDIALDTFPYSGGATSYHCLSAGVPLVTLEGTTEYARNGSSIMREMGLTDWIAQNHEEYLRIAATKSAQQEELSHIRNTVRSKLGMSAEQNTRALERALLELTV